MNISFALQAHWAKINKNITEGEYPDTEELLRKFEICHFYPENEAEDHTFDLNCSCEPDIEMNRTGILAIHRRLLEKKQVDKENEVHGGAGRKRLG